MSHGNQVSVDIDMGSIREIAVTASITYGAAPTVDGRVWLLASPDNFVTVDSQNIADAYGYMDVSRVGMGTREATKRFTVNARYIRFVLENADPAVNWGACKVWLHTCITP